ncbi:MAG: AbrB/MazE/SpoVT family DNA-binding domain-containing protein [Pseudomonadota bacterium]|nr:AbrB/MazE/SpoVT family DNA-binding domain-containing protein [Pseudomonadota bacterium]
MPDVRMRPKHQLTLPAAIVRQANIHTDDVLHVDYVNGAIILTPQTDDAKDDVLSYAGIFSGAWGDTPEQADDTLRKLRAEWNG